LASSFLVIAYHFSGSEWPRVALPQAPAGYETKPLSTRVVAVLIDGLRWDHANDPQLMPFLDSLKPRGAYGISLTGRLTLSPPGSRSLMTGRLTRLSFEIPGGHFTRREADSVFLRHRLGGGRSWAIGAEDWRSLYEGHYTDSFIQPFRGIADLDADDRALAYARAILRRQAPLLMVIDLHALDSIAHREGACTLRYRQRLQKLDRDLRGLWRALGDDGTMLVSAHHACDDEGHHGTDAWIMRATPYFLWGRGVARTGRRDIRQIDLAPTLAALLGLAPPAFNEGSVIAPALETSAGNLAKILGNGLQQKKILIENYARELHVRADLRPEALRRAQELLNRGEADAAAAAMGMLAEHYDRLLDSLTGSRSLTLLALAGMLQLGYVLFWGRFQGDMRGTPAGRRAAWAALLGALSAAAAAGLVAATRWDWTILGAMLLIPSAGMLIWLVAALHRLGVSWDRSDGLWLWSLGACGAMTIVSHARPVLLISAAGATLFFVARGRLLRFQAGACAALLLALLLPQHLDAVMVLRRHPAWSVTLGWAGIAGLAALLAPSRSLAMGWAAILLVLELSLPQTLFVRATVAAIAVLAVWRRRLPGSQSLVGLWLLEMAFLRAALGPSFFMLTALLLSFLCALRLRGTAPGQDREQTCLLFVVSYAAFYLTGHSLDYSALNVKLSLLGLPGSYSTAWTILVVALEFAAFFGVFQLAALLSRRDAARSTGQNLPILAGFYLLALFVQLALLAYYGGLYSPMAWLPGQMVALIGGMGLAIILFALNAFPAWGWEPLLSDG
jgi:hypothetical protein